MIYLKKCEIDDIHNDDDNNNSSYKTKIIAKMIVTVTLITRLKQSWMCR